MLRKHQHPNLLLYLSQHPDLQGVLCILALKCALRRNAVRFLNISTSESAPNPLCFFRFLLHGSTSQSAQSMRCFWHFDLEFIFAPQRRANFDLISPDGSAPAALASVLFDHSGKTECFGTFFFHAPASPFFWLFLFFLLPFSSLTLPTSTLPSAHVVGSLTSKLPSISTCPCITPAGHVTLLQQRALPS